MKKKLILYVAMASLLCWASIGVWSGKTPSMAAEGNDTHQANPDSDPHSTNPAQPASPEKPGSTGNQPATTAPTQGSGNSNGGSGSSNSGSGSSNQSSGGSSAAPSGQAATSSMGLPTSVADAVDKALEQGAGSTVVVDTDKVISSADLRRVAAAGGKLTVFCGPGISWHFAGLTNPDAELNPNVDIGANIPEITSKLNGVPGVAIRFMHNGALPGTAYVGLQVPFAKGTNLYFYYYNRSTQLFEFQQTTTVADGGYAVVALTHCSDYVLTTAPMTSGVANGPVPTTKNAGRLDGTPHTGI